MGSNKIMAIVLITMLINISANLLFIAIVDVDGDRVFQREDLSGLKQVDVDNYTDTFTNNMNETIKPAGLVEDKGDQIYRIMDAVSLGFIYKIINVIDQYMYGIVDILDNIFGNSLNDDVRVILFGDTNIADDTNINFGVLKLILTIMYTLFGVKLFSGTEVLPRS